MLPSKAILLAAGKSSRIASLSRGLPKPLIRVAETPIIIRNLRWLKSQGITEVFINLHFKPQEIRAVVGDGSALGLAVRYVEESEILGTAGAVRNIAANWTEIFAVVYGDNLISTDLRRLAEVHQLSGAIITIGLFDRRIHPHTGIAGSRVRVDNAGRIEAFTEGAGDELSTLVNAGIYLMGPSAVHQIPPGCFFDFGRDLFPAMLDANLQLQGELITGYCLGLDTPESYDQALAIVEEGKVILE
jgi:NDP-sugar pyrophosphorylase family protein